MATLHRGCVGILPAGALGVAFFHHLTHESTQLDQRVCFLERAGSRSGAALRESETLRIGERAIATKQSFRPDLLACFNAGWLPEIVLVCTQPDQLLGVLRTIVQLLERLHAAGALDHDVAEMPIFVLTSNGIYFQRVRQYFGEVIEEAIMFGRLPDLWENGQMPRIVGRLLRGVTIQTGHRTGESADAIYQPGPRGRTRLAGGMAECRTRAAEALGELGGWFESVAEKSVTRVEFDKALVNLCANLLGQLHAIDDAGRFRLLKVREILSAEGAEEIRTLAIHVVAVGRAVQAYAQSEEFETIHAAMLESARIFVDHVPSSLQWIAEQLRLGKLEPRLTPTEQWLLEPLIRYAHGAGLEDAAHYFEELTRRLEARLALAITASKAEVRT